MSRPAAPWRAPLRPSAALLRRRPRLPVLRTPQCERRKRFLGSRPAGGCEQQHGQPPPPPNHPQLGALLKLPPPFPTPLATSSASSPAALPMPLSAVHPTVHAASCPGPFTSQRGVAWGRAGGRHAGRAASERTRARRRESPSGQAEEALPPVVPHCVYEGLLPRLLARRRGQGEQGESSCRAGGRSVDFAGGRRGGGCPRRRPPAPSRPCSPRPSLGPILAMRRGRSRQFSSGCDMQVTG